MSSSTVKTAVLLFALLPALGLGSRAWAQDAEVEGETAVAAADDGATAESEDFYFGETVDVNLVNVDVWVTDKDGAPITGLTKDDFEVFEEKRPVTITNFYAVAGGKPVAGARTDTGPGELPVRDDDPLRLIPEDQRLNLVVYVDNFNIRPFNRNRVFRRLREFLQEKLGPGDRAMLISYDRSLNVRHPFTTDTTLLASATFELEKLTGYALHRDSDRRDIMREIEEAESSAEVRWRVRQYAESAYNDLSFSLDALGSFVDTLAGLPGRKAVLYVSDGLEMVAGEDLYYALSYRFKETAMLGEMRDFSAERKFKTLAHAANANRVTFYTIDAAGLRVYSSGTAERASAAIVPGLDAHVDGIQVRNLQNSLQFLAEQTGGLAIYNTNDIGDRLALVATDFSNYYSLGYISAHAGDGRFYDINVELKDPKRFGKKVEIRHRKGYRDRTTYDRMADGTTSSLRYNLTSNPLEVEISLGEGRPDDRHYLVPISVTVPLDQVVLVQQNDVYLGRLKLFFSAMDEEGDMADVTEVPLRLRIPATMIDAVRQQPYRLVQTELRMRRGGHRVAVGLRDEIGAVESFVTREILVGS